MIRQGMALIVFSLGIVSIALGLFMILSKEYQDALRTLSSHSTRLSGRAITEEGLAPILDGMARLLDAITRLIATAVGVGAFLCLMGIALAYLGFWMTSP